MVGEIERRVAYFAVGGFYLADLEAFGRDTHSAKREAALGLMGLEDLDLVFRDRTAVWSFVGGATLRCLCGGEDAIIFG